jgi:hypothetical protein
MSNYVIELNYMATIRVSVQGNFKDEGEALAKAREIADDADINEFNIGNELESRILEVNS